MNRNIGPMIISLTFIFSAIIIMMAQITKQTDEISREMFIRHWIYAIPTPVYFLLSISLIIGLYITFKDYIDNYFKK